MSQCEDTLVDAEGGMRLKARPRTKPFSIAHHTTPNSKDSV